MNAKKHFVAGLLLAIATTGYSAESIKLPEHITLETVRKLVARNEALINPIKMEYTVKISRKGERQLPVTTGKRKPSGRTFSHSECIWAQDGDKHYARVDYFYGTNEQGYYKYDGINWPYWITTVWKELIPSVLGYRFQQMYLNRVFEGPQIVDFKFEDFPVGTASLTGKVSDQNGDPLREFLISVRTQFDSTEMRKNPDGKFYNVIGYRIPFISEDGSFKLDDLPSGDFTVRVTPFNIRAFENHRGEEVGLEAGKTTNINLRIISKNIFYGRVLFRDDSHAVIKPTPWPGAKASILMTMGFRARGVAEVDDEGYFAVHLSDREVELLKSGKSRLIINVPTSEERRRKTMGDFPFKQLAKEKNKAGVIKIARPERTQLSLMNKSLPELKGIEIRFEAEQAKGKKMLVCFFDMNQRPARRCVEELGKQAEQLKQQGIAVVGIQAAEVDPEAFNQWIKTSDFEFPIGFIQGDTDEIKFNWGIQVLPWLILTDTEHIVRSEGFALSELDEKIKEVGSEKN